MQSRITGKHIIILMAALIVAMMTATLMEKAGHSARAFSCVYHSPLFIAAWAVTAILGIVRIVSVKMHRRPAVLGIHLAFLLILAGALATHLTSSEGRIHLRVGGTADSFEITGGGRGALPFTLTLEEFEVVRSSGGAAIDYVSSVTADGEEAEIAMNRILKKDGYRIFQAGYDEDEGGAWLSVTYDPVGTAVSYSGYWLLFACMILFFTDRESNFRKALRRLGGSGSARVLGTMVLLFGAFQANAAPKAIPEDAAREFGCLWVNYNGRICQVQTMARDYVLKVYGKASVGGFSAEQVFTGWMLYYDSWKDVPVKCKKAERGGPKELEKQQIVLDIASGRDLKIFPLRLADGEESEPVWYATASKLPLEIPGDEWTFIRGVNSLIAEYAWKGDWDEVKNVVAKISKFQQKVIGDDAEAILPSESAVRAERLYNAMGRPFVPAMASMTVGLALFLLVCLGADPSRRRWTGLLLFALSLAALAYLSAVLALRWFVSGHVPMTNGYEMMLCIAWFGMLLTCLCGRRHALAYCFGFLLAGFAMLVASLGQASPQIGTLMPVLSSPLLSIHVGCMMLSYTLLGVLALNGLLGLIRPGDGEAVDRGIIILYPALFFLTAGTFIGAIWANVSWGSYWAWDPKETWALITLLVYSAAVHSCSLPRFRSPAFFNAFCVLAFVCVLITYFGVNFFLGGAHSYA